METRIENIRGKYHDAKHGESTVDLLALKLEIESYVRSFRDKKEKNDALLEEAQDMLIDLTKIIEEGGFHPFKPKNASN